MRVDMVSRGLDALQSVALSDPQLIILDLGLPDFDGIELCRRLRSTQRCPIIIVTADGDEGRMVAALDHGADDYVTKPFGMEMLMARVRVALRHAGALAVTMAEHRYTLGDLVVDVPAHLATADDVPIELSPRQFRILTALIRNPGRILTHQQLSQVASGESGEVNSSDTLRGAMSHLRKRIGSGPQRPKIITEPHVGYRLIYSDNGPNSQ